MTQGKKLGAADRRRILKAWQDGNSRAEVARLTGFDRNTVAAVVNRVSSNSGQAWIEASRDAEFGVPVDPGSISDPQILAALADRSGRLWAERYFGVVLSPWQAATWEVMEDLYDSPDREWLCENAAPGLGKSTLLVMFASKQVAKDRAVRILFISRALSLAERNTLRLRRALERSAPAVGAVSTLAHDFGRFKPDSAGDVWRRNEFVVEQLDGSPIEQKEPTVSAFGFDAEWLGNRLDIVLGDDLDSTRSMANVETVVRNRQIFDDELEPRLDPGGLFAIAQQRLGPFDFSAHALAKRVVLDDDGMSDGLEEVAQYTHVVFKAHYDELCRGAASHGLDAPAWPDGCLLDPRRLTWRDVRKAQNNSRRWAVVYQQGESDESAALVPRLWIDGGRGPSGEDFPGCWDRDRGLGQVPAGLVEPNWSVVSCDPSPTKFWSIQWWLVNVPTEQRFLLDLVRQAMDANDFLDFNLNDGVWTGLLEEWWQRSRDIGFPFSTLIVEANAAQRFMLQYDLFRKWASRRQVTVVPHQTHRNKSDPEFGVQSIASQYRYGRVRLPGRQHGDMGRVAAMKLVDEVTKWPDTATDDCVMAQWFMEWNLPKLWQPPVSSGRQLRRPSWARPQPVG